ncbi:ImmA/IrrE family metallo-endopeptidase [Marinomonas hwangdonensis]|uniref:ImmA/IrrE family metallo-endopeptidase n=1 Tax=Marinomonas hwangdonensis TaxID=1053647 RepID=A0A3M8QA64_9GAMM|nr:ImmA/IrrE family metallo-endopeptidase [Marinomonas hwangdonensis]RNF52953.1 ImmA/IrrE family metallo-endopeptidase [Marinomonas hwangdonensis]
MKNSFEIVNEAMLSQPVDLDQLCSDLGIKLSRKRLPENMSGKIERKEENKFEITVNKKHGEYRQRFTIAHEIGHFILHRHLMGTGITDSIAYRTSDCENKNSNIKDSHEVEANRFAAALLLPKDQVIEKYNNLTGSVSYKISELASYFEVSTTAMNIRLKTFRLIN